MYTARSVRLLDVSILECMRYLSKEVKLQLINQFILFSEMYAQIIGLKKQNPSLNVLLSIGGGRLGSALFTKLVSSDSNIEVFAHNAINYLRARGFDGLDLDWEYPAKRGSPRRDKQRFTKWIQVQFI